MTMSVGDQFPEFNLKAVDGKKFDDIHIDNVFVDVNNESYKGKWLALFFYPKISRLYVQRKLLHLQI